MTFGDELRAKRVELGLTQQEAATVLGVTLARYQAFEGEAAGDLGLILQWQDLERRRAQNEADLAVVVQRIAFLQGHNAKLMVAIETIDAEILRRTSHR